MGSWRPWAHGELLGGKSAWRNVSCSTIIRVMTGGGGVSLSLPVAGWAMHKGVQPKWYLAPKIQYMLCSQVRRPGAGLCLPREVPLPGACGLAAARQWPCGEPLLKAEGLRPLKQQSLGSRTQCGSWASALDPPK